MLERSCLNKISKAKRFAGSHAQSLTLSSFLIIDLGCSGRYVDGAVKAKGPLQWRRQVMNRQAVCRHRRWVAARNRRLHFILLA
jgi:hypothetical protein